MNTSNFMEEQIKKLERKIMSQGKRISKLKNIQPELSDNEYKRLIDRIRVSENELVMQVEELNQENKELKDEIKKLLELLTESIQEV
jgi:hypothetical protein